MFTQNNTSGFTAADLDMLNAALTVLIERGIDEKSASGIINNNWQDAGNTVESLTRIGKPEIKATPQGGDSWAIAINGEFAELVSNDGTAFDAAQDWLIARGEDIDNYIVVE